MNRVTLLFDRAAERDRRLVAIIQGALSEGGYAVHVDLHLKISIDWARSVAEKIQRADAVIVAVSSHGLESEMLTYELESMNDAKLRNSSMRVIFVPIGIEAAALGNSSLLLGSFQTAPWGGPEDTAPLIAEILDFLTARKPQSVREVLLGSSGGGVSKESPFYIERGADADLRSFLQAGEATILVKGARQSGKTSLIGQGLSLAREIGFRACVTDFQRLGSNLGLTEDELYGALAADLARQMNQNYGLKLDVSWESIYGPTSNLDEFVRTLIGAREDRVVWFMDEADWLFATSFADSFFALVRSWHNARALSPNDVWNRFSVVIAYATEAHLFIQDINQSPFNVGRKIDLYGFTLRQTEELNRRYGEPLRGIDQVLQLHELLDGQPFLTRIAFDSLIRSNGNLRALLASAEKDDGPFGDHLRRVLVSVTQLSTVRDTVMQALGNKFLDGSPETDRLVAAGILEKNSEGNHVIRCKLYRNYLERLLK